MISLIALALMASAPDASDKEAVKLLRQVEAKSKALKSFSCDLQAERIYPSAKADTPPYHGVEKVHVEFARPNKFVLTSTEGDRTSKSVSDGKNLFWVGKDMYTKSEIDAKARNYHWYHDDLLLLLVTGSFVDAVEAPRPPVLKMLPDEQWSGATYKVIDAQVGGGYPISYQLYVGSDLLVHRVVHKEMNMGRVLSIESTAPEIVANPAQKSELFTFTPTADLKEQSTSFPLQPGEFAPMAIGAMATDFKLPTPSGGTLALSDAMKNSRAVLLNFWFVHCPPCRAEHPHLQKFHKSFRDKGLAVIAIDDQDSAEASAAYLKGAGLTFPVVLTGPRFRTDPATGQPDYGGPMMADYASLAPYGVRECPTNILIDSQTGKVLYRATEWNEKALREALAKIGVQ